MNNGFLRIAAAAPEIRVADVEFNVEKIISTVELLKKERVEIVVFPELSLTGYTCGDLFHSSVLLNKAKEGLKKLRDYSVAADIDIIVGLPISDGGRLFNCAALLRNGQIDIIKKTYLPNYNEFYEHRWFASGSETEEQKVIETRGVRIGIEICEDLWVTIPPSSRLALAGAEVIFNLSASDDLIGKYQYTLELVKQQSARCLCAYAYSSSGRGESSTDLVYAPKTIITENGTVLSANRRWEDNDFYSIADVDIQAIRRDRMHTTTFADCATNHNIASRALNLDGEQQSIDFNFDLAYRNVNPTPFVPSSDKDLDERCSEIINIQTAGLVQRLRAIGCRSLVVGVSGGLDSTLALLIAVRAFDRLGIERENIIGISMPGFGTTGRTFGNARALIDGLGATYLEIPIAAAVKQHFKDISHDPGIKDVTYENSQARERTQILMDVANSRGAIVLGTGDMSELALGWATYNGDHMSMYGVNVGVPKTLVKHLVQWFADNEKSLQLKNVLLDIIDTPISPELVPGDKENEISQKTEDLVGPYILHDFFLYYTLRYGFSPMRIEFLARKAFRGQFSEEEIAKWLKVFIKRFFSQQFKRSCLPDGPKVGSVCLSPRGDWRMPSDASPEAWLSNLA
ncbi:MAG: NAD(+) synthase [Paramuribaculum sp.]|nr:NAD(+) synthase [Paramuribaculum sp.]